MDYDFFNIYKNSPCGSKYRSVNNLNPLGDGSMAQYRANAEYDILAADNPNSLVAPTQTSDTISIGNPTDNSYGITLYVCGLNEIGNVTKLSFDIKISNYVYNKCLFYYELCLADSNGTVNQSLMGSTYTIAVNNTQYSNFANRNINGDTWEHVEVTFNNPSNVNYFLIGGWWGTYEIKNIIITGDGTYNWQSVPSISGKNGILSKSLAIIDDEAIGDGVTTQVTTDASLFNIPNSSNLYNMVKNLVDGEPENIAYCGDNYCTATRTTSQTSGGISVSVQLKFWLSTGVLAFTANLSVYSTALDDLFLAYMGFIIDRENLVAIFNPIFVDTGSVTQYQYNSYQPTENEMFLMYNWLYGADAPTHTSPYDWGSSDNGGTDGTLTPQDDLPSNGLPSVDGVDMGMFTIWMPNDQDFEHIADFLWSTNVVDNIRKYFNNVGECVLGLYILPYTADTGIASKKFKIGNMVDSDYTNVTYLTSRYRSIDMGSFNIDAVWNSYLDYSPYSKIEVFLPYCGLHQLDIDEFMSPANKEGLIGDKSGSEVSCEYRIDLLTGGVVVYLKLDNQVRYQFSGKMGCTLPVTGNNYATMVQTLIQGVSGLASTVVSHSISAPYAQSPVAPTPPASPALGASKKEQSAFNKAMKQYNVEKGRYDSAMESQAKSLGHSAGVATGAAIAGTVQSMKPDVIRAGNISGDISMLGYDRPYIIKTRPNKPQLSGQENFTGFPSYKRGKVGDFKGYTEFIKVHLEGLPCTGYEQEDIEKMLQGGVIINDNGSAKPDVTPTVEGNLVVVFLKMISEVNVLGKNWKTGEGDIWKTEGKLIYDNSVGQPTVLINGDCKSFNYAYIPFFDRFYYIQDYVVTREYLQEVSFAVDPLQSFIGVKDESGILNCEGIVSRSASNPNFYINDGVFYTEQRSVVTYHCFKKEGQIKKFDTQQIYLITAG